MSKEKKYQAISERNRQETLLELVLGYREHTSKMHEWLDRLKQKNVELKRENANLAVLVSMQAHKMPKPHETVTLKKAIETYGAEAQLNVAIEELSELAKEICKHKRGADNTDAIVEEMADCYIMLDQMQMIFGIPYTDIFCVMDKKVKRLEKRLQQEAENEI